MQVTKQLQLALDSLRDFGVTDNAIQHLLKAIGHDKEENNKTRYKERKDLAEFVFNAILKKNTVISTPEMELSILEKICEGCEMPSDEKPNQMIENAKKLKTFLDDKNQLQKD